MKIADALVGVHRLYFDTSPFIYYVEDHPDYGDKMQRVFDVVDLAAIEIITSVISLTETLAKPLKAGDETVVQAYSQLLESAQSIHLVPVNANIAKRAADLRARENLRTPDALHLATATETQCDAVLTNDKSFHAVAEPRILLLDELELDIPASES